MGTDRYKKSRLKVFLEVLLVNLEQQAPHHSDHMYGNLQWQRSPNTNHNPESENLIT